MKDKLALDTLWKAIFTICIVQILRFETESTLEMTDYHKVFAYTFTYKHAMRSITTFQWLSMSNLRFID
jgi:hypothetical protein